MSKHETNSSLRNICQSLFVLLDLLILKEGSSWVKIDSINHPIQSQINNVYLQHCHIQSIVVVHSKEITGCSLIFKQIFHSTKSRQSFFLKNSYLKSGI